MEGDRHYSVAVVKGVLNAVTMVDVDVNIENTRMISSHNKSISEWDLIVGLRCLPQKFENSENNVVHIAEATSLGLLGVVVVHHMRLGFAALPNP